MIKTFDVKLIDAKSMDNITDEEVRGLFEMIDRDKSGSLTMRV